MQKYLKHFICLLFMLVLLVSNIIFFVDNNRNKSKIISLNSEISRLQNQNDKLLKEEKADYYLTSKWKRYSNEKFNFAIYYPEEVAVPSVGNYKVDVTEDSYDSAYKIFFSPDISDFPIENLPPTFFGLSIYNNGNTRIKEFIKKEAKDSLSDSNVLEIEPYLNQIKIDDIDSYKLELPNGDIKYYVVKNTSIFVISSFGSIFQKDDFENFKPIFYKISESFKFTK